MIIRHLLSTKTHAGTTDYNLSRLNPVLKHAVVIGDYTVLTVTVILTELYKLIRTI